MTVKKIGRGCCGRCGKRLARAGQKLPKSPCRCAGTGLAATRPVRGANRKAAPRTAFVELSGDDHAALAALLELATPEPAHRTVTASALIRQLIRDAARQKRRLTVKLDELARGPRSKV